MKVAERKSVLIQLGLSLQDIKTDDFQELFMKAKIENPWFTIDNIEKSLSAIRDEFLTEKALNKIISNYHLDDNIQSKKIGLILAGNIPLVGIHDVICCFICGHTSVIKYSDKDSVLMKWMVDEIIRLEPKATTFFIKVEKLKEYDAIIATGSNATAVHFEHYFSHVPHIIRRNRNSIAILTGKETHEQLHDLATDIFSYFGMGCRNVSMVLLPDGYPIKNLFEAFEPYKDIIHHHKYKNNYDYNLALMLLNKEKFLQNDFLIFKESDQIISRIASVHYMFYSDENNLLEWLGINKEAIQCVVTGAELQGIPTIPFGNAQCPAIDDFADGVDTIKFLLGVS